MIATRAWVRHLTYLGFLVGSILTANPLNSSAQLTVHESITIEVISPLTLAPSNPYSGQLATGEFAVRNYGAQTIQINRLGIGVRGPGCTDWACQNYQDFPFDEQVVIAPGQVYTFTANRIFWQEGAHFAQISYESPPGAWFFLGERMDFVVTAGLQVVNPLSLIPPSPRTDDLVFAEFGLKNIGFSPMTLLRVGVGARGPGCSPFDWGCHQNVDFGYENNVTLNPGETKHFRSWRIFAEQGAYFAQISAEDELGQWHQLDIPLTFTALAAVNTPRNSELRFATTFHQSWNNTVDDYELALMRSTGAQVVRIGASWRLLEPQGKGQWDSGWYIPALGRLIGKANALGMGVFVLVLQVPCWASSDPNKQCAIDRWDIDYPPSNPADYADALRKLVELYGDQVVAWEVWNEPNIARFWKPAPDAAAYTQLLQSAYSAVKPDFPEAIILGGSLAGSDTLFLDTMYQSGAKGYFDALALHPYTAHAPDSCADQRWAYLCGVSAIRSMMLHYNDPKDIWFTEFGWSSFTGPGGVGEETQSLYLQEALMLLDYWDFVPVATWYTLVDTNFNMPDLEHEDYMGLYDRAYRAKPAAGWLRDTKFPYREYLPVIRN